MLETKTNHKEADLHDYCSIVAKTNGIDPIGSAPVISAIFWWKRHFHGQKK